MAFPPDFSPSSLATPHRATFCCNAPCPDDTQMCYTCKYRGGRSLRGRAGTCKSWRRGTSLRAPQPPVPPPLHPPSNTTSPTPEDRGAFSPRGAQGKQIPPPPRGGAGRACRRCRSRWIPRSARCKRAARAAKEATDAARRQTCSAPDALTWLPCRRCGESAGGRFVRARARAYTHTHTQRRTGLGDGRMPWRMLLLSSGLLQPTSSRTASASLNQLDPQPLHS
jgi:hypothetical protein